MTFKEFMELNADKTTTEGMLREVFYNKGPFAWTSDIKTKQLVAVNWRYSKIKYYDLSIEDELNRRNQFKAIGDYKRKLESEQLKLEKLKEDFK